MTKTLTLDVFNHTTYQICFQNIDTEYAYALLVKFNAVEQTEHGILIKEMTFQIHNYFFQNNKNKMLFSAPFITLDDNTCNESHNHAINFNFYVIEADKNETDVTHIYNEPIEIPFGGTLHFTNFVNGYPLHDDDLCPGVRDCNIHIPGTYIPKK